MESKTQRIEYIDIVKGIGIILVVMGHCITGRSILWRCIYSFHMPLFFFISGLCLNMNRYPSVKGFILKRTKQLMIPCLIMSVFVSIGGEYLLKRDAIKALYDGLPWALWFIPILFLGEIVYYLIKRINTSKYSNYIEYVLLILLVIMGGWFQKMNFKLPYSITTLPASIVFFSLGNIYREKFGLNDKKNNSKNILLFIISIAVIITSVLKSTLFTDMHYNIMRPLILNYLCAIIGIIGAFSLSKVISSFNSNTFKTILLFCGKNTLVIMGIHSLFLNISRLYLKPIIYNESSLNSISIYYTIEQIILWSLVVTSIFFINKKMPVVAGK